MPQHRTLIFHIGDHKTGSTSIQHVFAKEQVSFDGKSLLYPAKIALNVLEQRFNAWAAADTPEAREEAAKPLAQLARQIDKARADFTVISAEAFEQVPAAVFRQVVEHFFAPVADEIRIIAYVRPHAPRILSSFCERTKIGTLRVLTQTPADFAEARKQDGSFFYHARFSAWRAEFGTAFTLRPMVRGQLRNGSVVEDFLHHAFQGLPYSLHQDDTANESLDLMDLMRLKVLQTALQDESIDLRLKVGWEFSRLLGHMPPPESRRKLQLHKALAQDIQATYQDDARAMDRDFFAGEPVLEGDLESTAQKAVTEEQSVDPARYLPAGELRTLEVMSGFVSGLLENKEVGWPYFLHRKRLRDIEAAKARQNAHQQTTTSASD